MISKDFGSGFAFGMIAGIVLMCIFILSTYSDFWSRHPECKENPNDMLNSSEWKIDTIKTIVGNDTTVIYKFKQL